MACTQLGDGLQLVLDLAVTHDGEPARGRVSAHLALYDLICVCPLVKFPDLPAKRVLEDSPPCVVEHGCASKRSVCRWLRMQAANLIRARLSYAVTPVSTCGLRNTGARH